MASRSVSPGGALLRASRIFSIPSPLPRPSGELSSTAIFNSDTATLPHPIQQSITTPQSSLKRGDWGFKRPLPLRSTTRTSTPLIRVDAIDTFEHVTEFNSSADHALSLQKWQEMGIPLSTPTKKRQSNFMDPIGSGKGVFEDEIDSTAPSQGGILRKDDARWKFNGPWLAGQTEGEFNTYVQKEVRRRKGDFQKFLRTACANAATKEAQRTATEQGEEIGPPMQASDITEEQLTSYIKSLRRDDHELYKQIRIFLDLPPPPNPTLDLDILGRLSFEPLSQNRRPQTINADHYKGSDSPYSESGPPKTHPSAGLAYGRTSSHTFNHPVYGPQKYKSPVQARVVMPKGAATGNFGPRLGVGGFVTDVPSGADSSFDLRASSGGAKRARPNIPGLLNIEPDRVGGSKTYVHPQFASIDPKGRVILSVAPADPEAVSVKEGTVDDIPAELQRPPMVRPRGLDPPVGTQSGYGLGGFDKEERSRADLDRTALSELGNIFGNG